MGVVVVVGVSGGGGGLKKDEDEFDVVGSCGWSIVVGGDELGLEEWSSMMMMMMMMSSRCSGSFLATDDRVELQSAAPLDSRPRLNSGFKLDDR